MEPSVVEPYSTCQTVQPMPPLVWAWRSLGESPTDRLRLRSIKQSELNKRKNISSEPLLRNQSSNGPPKVSGSQLHLIMEHEKLARL
jgi:hypothetical protein